MAFFKDPNSAAAVEADLDVLTDVQRTDVAWQIWGRAWMPAVDVPYKPQFAIDFRSCAAFQNLSLESYIRQLLPGLP